MLRRGIAIVDGRGGEGGRGRGEGTDRLELGGLDSLMTVPHYTIRYNNHLSSSFFSRCCRFPLDRFPRIHYFMLIITNSHLKSSLTLRLIYRDDEVSDRGKGKVVE